MASGVGIFFAILLILILLGLATWILYTRHRASRLGLPPPPLNPFTRSRSGPGIAPASGPRPSTSGPVSWIKEKITSLKNGRYASGAGYEGGGGGGRGARGGRGGHVPLDPDEAWDSRVGNEADVYGPGGYYEEQELGLHEPVAGGGAGASPYGAGDGYGYVGGGPVGVGGLGADRGRSRTRVVDERYEEEVQRGGLKPVGGRASAAAREDPFGDAAEPSNISLRGVSPRPLDTSVAGRERDREGHGADHNSPSERRSMFREDV
ncbi:hypothetical protein K490DRAFT_48324 [Saccharata proteae CBS 121410]|uniref:Uncharacterized protein n=1 Tax=Saccharata proteae CBS 121410 TaxID=1314787 RepID=A0A9P4LSS0_9PEZI|nr:hypothetical protein K490DRAFT_48324 [Saccharata proteae CBS 121410]